MPSTQTALITVALVATIVVSSVVTSLVVSRVVDSKMQNVLRREKVQMQLQMQSEMQAGVEKAFQRLLAATGLTSSPNFIDTSSIPLEGGLSGDSVPGVRSVPNPNHPDACVVVDADAAQSAGVVIDKKTDTAEMVLEGSGSASELRVKVNSRAALSVENPSLKVTVNKTLQVGENVGTVISGSTLSTTSGDLTVTAAGSKVNLGTGKTLDTQGGSTTLGDTTLPSGKTLDVSAGTLSLADNQISGDKVEGGTINAVTVNTLTSSTVQAGTVTTASGDLTLTSAGTKVALASGKSLDTQAGTTTLGDTTLPSGKTLDLSAGTLTMADNQISGDKVEGGTVNAMTVNTLTSTTVQASTVTTTSGDLALTATGTKVVLGSGKNLDTQAGTTTLGDTTLPSGKTLDASAGTLALADNQISGDKVEGGTINAVTVNTLTSSTVQAGTVTTASGDLTLTSAGTKITFGSGKILDAQAGSTTLGNTTVPSGKTLDVSAGTLALADNQISGDKVEGGTITAITVTTLTSSTVKTGAVTTDSGDLTVTAAGTKVALGSGKILDTEGGSVTLGDTALPATKTLDVSAGSTILGNATLSSTKTLDVSAGTLTLADNQISGNKINGGVIDSTTITTLTSDTMTANTIKLTGDIVDGATCIVSNGTINCTQPSQIKDTTQGKICQGEGSDLSCKYKIQDQSYLEFGTGTAYTDVTVSGTVAVSTHICFLSRVRFYNPTGNCICHVYASGDNWKWTTGCGNAFDCSVQCIPRAITTGV